MYDVMCKHSLLIEFASLRTWFYHNLSGVCQTVSASVMMCEKHHDNVIKILVNLVVTTTAVVT